MQNYNFEVLGFMKVKPKKYVVLWEIKSPANESMSSPYRIPYWYVVYVLYTA